MKTQHFLPNGEIVQYDRTADASMIAFAQRSHQPLFEVKGTGGGTVEIETHYSRAQQLLAKIGRGSVWQIDPTGKTHCILRMGFP